MQKEDIERLKALLSNDLDKLPDINKADVEWDCDWDLPYDASTPTKPIPTVLPINNRDEGWRYGIVKTITKDGTYYAIHEVFCKGDEDIKNMGWSATPVHLVADTKEELQMMITLAAADVSKYKVIVDNEVTGEQKLEDQEVL